MIPRIKKMGKLKVTAPLKKAAGLNSIVNTVKESILEAGFLRSRKILSEVNQKGGTDCNSCAWADPDDERTAVEFCESGAKAIASEATKKRLSPAFFSKYSVAELREKNEKWLGAQGRITEPIVLLEGETHYKAISWENSFKLIAEELNSLASPDEAIFYTSGRTSNEAAFLYQLFVRQFGTNNLPDCSNMCHESTSVALTESIGLGKASVRLEDLENTDLIIIIGQNPGTCAPRMMISLERAKKNGAKIIAINPLPEAGLMNFVNPNPQHATSLWSFPRKLLAGDGTPLTDLHLPVRIGGDAAVLKGILKILVEREMKNPSPIFDYSFITEKTSGYEDFIEMLNQVSWEDILEESGLTIAQIEQSAEMYLEADRVITCWAMGVTQHAQAVSTIQDIANLHFLRGQIGRQGAGLCPVRGHSNVQGDRSMGISENLNETFRRSLEKEFNFIAPKKHGLDTVNSIRAMAAGRARVFFALGGNFVSAAPDTALTEEAFSKCSLTAQVITKLNRTALFTGKRSLILPCLGRTEKDIQNGVEQFVSTESTMLNVQMSKGVLEPASDQLRSEVWIVGKLAKTVLRSRATFDWDSMISNYDNIRSAISRVVPGCENYNERIRNDGGFYMPNKPRQRVFPTESGKAVFKASPLQRIKLEPGQLLLTSIRAHDQFNTTIYTDDDRYRGIKGSRRVILMNEVDIRERDLREGQSVDITSHFGDSKRRAENFTVVSYPIPLQCAATYFPEANVLVSIDSTAERSNCPASKLIKVTLEARVENGRPLYTGKFKR